MKKRSHHHANSRKTSTISSGSRSILPQRYVIVLLLFLCTAVCYIERIGFSIAYTAVARTAGVGDSTKGMLLSAFYYGYTISQLPGGWAAQRWGGRSVLFFSFLLWSITSALTPATITVPVDITNLVVARVLVGVAQGFIFPSIHNVLAQWVPSHERSRSVSLTTSGMYLGAAAGMLWLPDLVGRSGVQCVLRGEAVMGASWAILWFRFSKDPYGQSSRKSSRAKHLLPVQAVDLEDGDGNAKQKDLDVFTGGVIPWKKIMLSWAVWAIVINNFTFHYTLYILMNWLPTFFAQSLRLSLTQLGMWKALPYLIMFLLSNVGGVAADSLIRRRIYTVTITRKLLNTLGFSVAAVGLLLMSSMESAAGAVICSSLVLGASSLARAGFAVNHMDIAPRYAGIVMGVSNTAGTVAGVIGVSATGWILEFSGGSGWSLVFAVPALLSVLSASIFIWFATGETLFE